MDVIVVHIHDGKKIESLFGVFESKESFKTAYKDAGFEIDELSGLILGTVKGSEKMLTSKTVPVK